MIGKLQEAIRSTKQAKTWRVTDTGVRDMVPFPALLSKISTQKGHPLSLELLSMTTAADTTANLY